MLNKISQNIPIVDVVIFGSYGELVLCKIMPALYYLFSQNYINDDSRIISVVRNKTTSKQYEDLITKKLIDNLPQDHCFKSYLEPFTKILSCVSIDVTNDKEYSELNDILESFKERDRIYYRTDT